MSLLAKLDLPISGKSKITGESKILEFDKIEIFHSHNQVDGIIPQSSRVFTSYSNEPRGAHAEKILELADTLRNLDVVRWFCPPRKGRYLVSF